MQDRDRLIIESSGIGLVTTSSLAKVRDEKTLTLADFSIFLLLLCRVRLCFYVPKLFLTWIRALLSNE